MVNVLTICQGLFGRFSEFLCTVLSRTLFSERLIVKTEQQVV